MASTFAATRNHLIFGLCLPLAVLLGYLLAEPFASTTVVVVAVLAAVLMVPIMLRWYHPLLILSWHMAMYPIFFPGRVALWVPMALAGLLFVILHRSVDANYRWNHEPSLTTPLLVFALVIIATAVATGGIGLRVLGSKEIGGRGYVLLLAAIVGYFVLSSRSIQPRRAQWAIALFFLSGITYTFGYLALRTGSGAEFLTYLFPLTSDSGGGPVGPTFESGGERIDGLMPAAVLIYCWLLARYGATGILAWNRPWRVLVLAGVVGMGCFGGFRSMLVLMGLIFLILLYLERIWRGPAFLIFLMGLLISGVGIVFFANKLPLPVQRTLAFLPVEVDPVVRIGADSSTEWRVQMWRSVIHLVPQYLLLGKGYSLSAEDMYMERQDALRGFSELWSGAALAGDYHSGPLSVIIPFGIWGALAFGWVLYAGTRHLYRVYRDGAESLRTINRLLFALFVARILFFLFVFGALYTEFYYFTGILGMSVALNSTERQSRAESAAEVAEGELNQAHNMTIAPMSNE